MTWHRINCSNKEKVVGFLMRAFTVGAFIITLASIHGHLSPDLFAAEYENNQAKAKQNRVKMDGLRKEQERLKHPKIHQRLTKLAGVYAKDGGEAARKIARRMGVNLDADNKVKVSIISEGSEKRDFLKTILYKTYGYKFENATSTSIDGYVSIDTMRAMADKFEGIRFIGIPTHVNPLVVQSTGLDYSPQLCESHGDCMSMSRSCGDVYCSPSKVSCTNGICCGSTYDPANTLNVSIASEEDLGHLTACANDMSRYHELDFCEIFPLSLEMRCKHNVFDYTAFDESNPTICDSIKNDGALRDHCYSMVAKKMARPELCELVLNTSEKNICLSFIYTSSAHRTNNIFLCSKVPILHSDDIYFQYAQDTCYSGIAANTGDITICDNISQSTRESCKKQAAIKAMDYQYCVATKDDHCLWFIAAEIDPVDLISNCEKLQKNTFNEQECKEKLYSICEMTQELGNRCKEEVNRKFKMYEDIVKPDH